MYIRRTVVSNMLTPFHTLKTEPTHVWPPSLMAQNRTATVNSCMSFQWVFQSGKWPYMLPERVQPLSKPLSVFCPQRGLNLWPDVVQLMQVVWTLFSYVPFGVTVMVLGCPDYLQTAAYAFTDYQTQGQMIPVVMVDVAKPPMGKLDLFNLYVALSHSSGRSMI